VVGILNGVDYDEWDPRHDPHIAGAYSPARLAGKAACRRDLLAQFGLGADPDLPILGAVSRLVPQKGFDIVVEAGAELLRRPLRLVVLGSGAPEVEEGFRALARAAPDRVALRVGYDETLAHKVIAGSDVFLMPSRFEPCGLTQMYSLRYGTVPLVRATGGLVDTVEPYDAATDRGTGFLFDSESPADLLRTLDRALAVRADGQAWRRLMGRGMARDFSWDRSAREYVELYRRAIGLA